MIIRDSMGRFKKGSIYSLPRQEFICRLCSSKFKPKDYVRRVYCSKECLNKSGYLKERRMPSGQMANNWRYGSKEYYRMIARKLLNRIKQKDNLVIHHLDGNVENNDIRNLKVMTRSEHTHLHWLQGDIR